MRRRLGDGDAVGDEDARGAVGEMGQEGKLATVVERARAAVAVPGEVIPRIQAIDHSEVAGRYFQEAAFTGDELHGAGPINGPEAESGRQ